MRCRIILIMLLIILLSVCSCANNSEPAEHEGEYIAHEADPDDNTESESVSESEEEQFLEDEVSDSNAEESESDDDQTDTDESGNKTWKEAYAEFIKSVDSGDAVEYYDENGVLRSEESWLSYYRENIGESECSFYLYDLDNDGIPELFLDMYLGYSDSVFSYQDGRMTFLNLCVGYETSGHASLYQYENTSCFLVTHSMAMGGVKELYTIENGSARLLLGCGARYTSEDLWPDYYNGDDDTISEEDFCRLFNEYTGTEWNTEWTVMDQGEFDSVMEKAQLFDITRGERYSVKDVEEVFKTT